MSVKDAKCNRNWCLLFILISICIALSSPLFSILFINTQSSISSLNIAFRMQQSTNYSVASSSGCHWHPPSEYLPEYKPLTINFKLLSFDHQSAMDYIGSRFRSKHCSQTNNVYIFNFHQNHTSQLSIAIATIIILSPPLNTRYTYQTSIFSDLRTYHLKLANALLYCEQHGYSLIIQFAPIWKYSHSGNASTALRKEYEQAMNSATNQKPFLVSKYLPNYDWILWMDYDTLFVHCQSRIEHALIDYAHSVHPEIERDSLSMIFGGEWYGAMNAGVWMIRNTEWSMRFLSDWMFITENAGKYQLLKIKGFTLDQTIFVALLQRYSVNRTYIDEEEEYKQIELRRDYGARWYLLKRSRKQNVSLEALYRSPIADANVAEYAVAIDEVIINAKISQIGYHRYKEYARRDETFIIHYYSKDKAASEKSEVFRTLKLVSKHCRHALSQPITQK